MVKDYPDGPHLFDRDGVDFATAPPPAGRAVPRHRQPRAQRPADQGGAAGDDVTAARGGRTGRPCRGAVGRVDHPDLIDGRTVVWGTTDRTEEKAVKLGALLTQPGQTYDVSSPDLPTVK